MKVDGLEVPNSWEWGGHYCPRCGGPWKEARGSLKRFPEPIRKKIEEARAQRDKLPQICPTCYAKDVKQA